MIDGLCRGHISRRDRKELAVRTSSSLATMGSYKYWDRTHLIGPDSSMWIRTRRGSRIQGAPRGAMTLRESLSRTLANMSISDAANGGSGSGLTRVS